MLMFELQLQNQMLEYVGEIESKEKRLGGINGDNGKTL
jgi:hypothetical protein